LACEVVGVVEWVANAKACLVWLAWLDHDVGRVAEEAEELIMTAVGSDAVWEPIWKWVYLWPLVALNLADAKVDEAAAAGLQMLEPSQQRLPDELESLLESAGAAWASDQPEVAAAKLRRALELAHDLHFF
jgi:hypothetical protein